MRQACKKCGETSGHPKYDSANDVLRFLCICGYTWTREPLDQGKLQKLLNPIQHALNTGHGHVYPRPDGNRARCGGPSMCAECAKDLARQQSETLAPR